MNYSSVITGGVTALVTAWWFCKRRMDYVGPQMVVMASAVTYNRPGSVDIEARDGLDNGGIVKR